MQTTGDYLWLDQEEQLDAVTALSGSGPAYVFYFIEAMIAGRHRHGPEPRAGASTGHRHFCRRLGAGPEARSEPPEVLRARVTSKGGTTYAALTSMEQDGIKQQVHQSHARRAPARQRTGR